MRLDENVFHHKEHSEDAERRVEFLPITAKAVDSHVGDYTTENTIGAAISQRHHDDGYAGKTKNPTSHPSMDDT